MNTVTGARNQKTVAGSWLLGVAGSFLESFYTVSAPLAHVADRVLCARGFWFCIIDLFTSNLIISSFPVVLKLGLYLGYHNVS